MLRLTACAVSLPLRADAERGDTVQSSCSRPGAILETSYKLMKAKVYSKKVARFVSVCLLWRKKAAKGSASC